MSFSKGLRLTGHPPAQRVYLFCAVTMWALVAYVSVLMVIQGVPATLPYVAVTLSLLPAVWVVARGWVGLGAALTGLSIISLFVIIGLTEGRTLELMAWFGLPFLAIALVRNEREALPWLVVGALSCVALDLHAHQEFRTPQVARVGVYFVVLYVSVRLFVRAKGAAVLRVVGLLQQLEQVAEQHRLAESRAREAERRQADFLALMSHEIRTPLHGIIGVSQILNSPSPGQDTQPFIEALSESSRLLLSLLDDVLDLSKLDAGELVIQTSPVDVAALLTRIVTSYRGAVKAPDVVLELELDPSLPAGLLLDESRIAEVIGNLIGNAAKFTHEGRVVLRARWNEGMLDLEVQDTGVGIPQQSLPQLFDRFSQAKAGRSKGTGLGLALVREVTVAMGGQVQVDSKEGEGSRFSLHIPAESAELPQRVETVESLDGLHLLLVDDNAVNRLIGAKLFENRGARVTLAEDGLAALEQLTRGLEPDLVLTDLHMPRVDGLELLSRIRAGGHGCPTIAVSAGVGAEREQALATGMAAFVSKPIDVDRAVSQILAVQRAPLAAHVDAAA